MLTTFTAAVFLGISAQILAGRFRVPAILPLLVLGIGAGTSSFGLGLVHPDSLGHGLDLIIHLGVAVILFEGGLSLDLGSLAKVGGAVRNLLTIGVAITGVLSAAIARYLIDIPWSTAALFGAIVTVTGPTVVAPLLRHMVAPREVKTVLLSEGLIVDPIGAVLAYFVLQVIGRAEIPVRDLSKEILLLSLTGAAVGFLAGSLARAIAQRRLIAAELQNVTVLAILMLGYLISESQAPQSGILAAVVMGVTVSGSRIPDLVRLKTFKEQLTTLLISMLFILLSAQLDVEAMVELGWRGLAVVAGLILIVRPLSVWLSVWPGELGTRERVLLGFTAPRGIVAAAVASLASRQLTRADMAGGTELEGLVYLVILVTGASATFAAIVLPSLLGYKRDPSRRLTVMIGSSPLSVALGELLLERDRTVAIVDSSRTRLAGLRDKGFRIFSGDARNASLFEDVEIESDTAVLALTTNDELNLLVAELVHGEFGVEHPVIVLQQPADEFGTRRRAWIDLFGGRQMQLGRWNRRLEAGEASFVTIAVDSPGRKAAVRDALREVPLHIVTVCGWRGDTPTFEDPLEKLDTLEQLTLLVTGEGRRELAQLIEPREEPADDGDEDEESDLDEAEESSDSDDD